MLGKVEAEAYISIELQLVSHKMLRTCLVQAQPQFVSNPARFYKSFT